MSASPRILVIRRDNIGDLVCTTPLLHALRRQLPDARIECLVTRYNRAVLANHPDIDALHAYTKAKHRAPHESVAGLYWQRARTVMRLRRQRFDWVILPGGGSASALRFARWIAGRNLLVRDAQDEVAGPHEVERCCHLLPRMGLAYETPASRIFADPAEIALMRSRLASELPLPPRRLIGLHISARKASQRWPAEAFAELARRLADAGDACMLLWAPGSADDPLHPGDDAKAAQVRALAAGLPLLAVPTQRLEELIAALSLCDTVICSDGGAMHLAAGLGKPAVCLFGRSSAARWHPWGVPFRLLQAPSQEVTDVGVAEVAEAHDSLVRAAQAEAG
ncbi:MAG: glycosyltransferase family 9 protein [Rhodocyclaceae bacterium]